MYLDEFDGVASKKQSLKDFYYGQSVVKTTIDGEWEYDELYEEIFSIAKRVLEKTGKKSTTPYLLQEEIAEEHDIMELYNKLYDKHKNDADMLFGITYFENEVERLIYKKLGVKR